MFNCFKAKQLLEQDQHKYLLRTKKFLDYYLEKGLDEAAAQIVMTAGEELTRLIGAMLYLEQVDELSDNYPRFEAILGDEDES